MPLDGFIVSFDACMLLLWCISAISRTAVGRVSSLLCQREIPKVTVSSATRAHWP